MCSSKKSIARFLLCKFLFFTLLAGISSAAAETINEKIAKLDVKNANLEDVIKIFGEPARYLWGDKTFTKDNLPQTYLAEFGAGFDAVFSSGRLTDLRFESAATGYIFNGKIRIGSSLDEVLSEVGQPQDTITAQPLPNMAQEGILYKDIDGKIGYCYYKPANRNVRFFLSNYKVSALYVTIPKSSGGGSSHAITPIDSVKEYNDVRWRDLSKLNLVGRKGLIASLTFNQPTVWPPAPRLPGDRIPQKVLENAKNPGLGVRVLHQQGVTGKGVSVAIIDQAMYLDHPEFSGKVADYHNLAGGNDSSMHGPAVTSLLAGTNCGTAPDSTVYYVAARDGVYEVDYVDGIDWIIEKNTTLPVSQKIRVVSVSAAPGIAGTASTDSQKKWEQACARAEKAGILVLDCTESERGFIRSCWYSANEPEDVKRCTPGFPGMTPSSYAAKLLVPASPRTVAEEYDKGNFSYQYTGRGGLSWAIPYCAGVLAMGWQINPDLSPEQMRQLLFQSAYVTPGGDKIINPREFINQVRKTKGPEKTEKNSELKK